MNAQRIQSNMDISCSHLLYNWYAVWIVPSKLSTYITISIPRKVVPWYSAFGLSSFSSKILFSYTSQSLSTHPLDPSITKNLEMHFRKQGLNILTKHDLLLSPALHIYSDRKSTRLNSSHVSISYAVFCLKNKILY